MVPCSISNCDNDRNSGSDGFLGKFMVFYIRLSEIAMEMLSL